VVRRRHLSVLLAALDVLARFARVFESFVRRAMLLGLKSRVF
jgi:hypothetical protein